MPQCALPAESLRYRDEWQDKQIWGLGDLMAQWVKCLLWKLENLSSDPQHWYKKASLRADGHNPSTVELRQPD